MRITLNGESYECEGLSHVASLLTALGIAGVRVAVMVNDEIVKKAHYEEMTLAEGDRVEVIHMVGGG